MSSSSSSTVVSSTRSLGSGTFNHVGERTQLTQLSWSVELEAQRTHVSNQPPLTVQTVRSRTAGTEREFCELSGLTKEDLLLLSANKIDMDLREALTPTTPSSSPTSSICSADDDACSSDCSDELSTSAALQIDFTPPDIYGQKHPIESSTLLEFKLREFDDELKKLCPSVAANLVEADARCPELVTSNFKLIFLRCECFDAEKAAKRYAKYWDKRVEIFGATRAFRALTIESMQEDMSPIEIGAMQIIRRPKTDPDADERDILYFDSGRLDPSQYSRESGCRAFWYFFHTLLEDEQVQRKGLVCINYAATLTNRNRDPCFARMCVSSLTGCIPIRLSVFHGCHLPGIYRIASRVFMLLIGERMRKRVLTHAGLIPQVQALLETKYDIPRSVLPTEMGGDLVMDIESWIQERRAAGL